MHTELCDRFGIKYPIFVFTPSEKVAAAVRKAGGLGMLGCVRFNDADDLEAVLRWMDDNTDGRPYGVDIVMPAKVPSEGTAVDINKLIPQGHRDFVSKTLADLGVPPLPDAPEALPMPLQNILVSEAHQRMNESTDPTAVAMPVGQIVGRMNEIRPVADIIAELVSGFEAATRRLDEIAGR
jgi:NAD(P)H-dependent flavin oxidoreductase YrpB (nitropropane dioxygenase family)